MIMLILCNTSKFEVGYAFDTIIGGYELHNVIEIFILGPGRIVLPMHYSFKPVPTVNHIIRAFDLEQAWICVVLKYLPPARLRAGCLLGRGRGRYDRGSESENE